MFEFQMRPNLRLLLQIAKIERAAGAWDRLSNSSALASDERAERALSAGAAAALALDCTTPAVLAVQLREAPEALNQPLLIQKEVIVNGQITRREPVWTKHHNAFNVYLEAHRQETPFNVHQIKQLYSLLNGAGLNGAGPETPGETNGSELRSRVLPFLSMENRIVFPTISTFLVEQRLEELIDWVNRELESELLHPLVVIAVFHLVFLQTHPFSTANHRLALLLTWRLLKKNGYELVAYEHFAPALLRQQEQYFSTLRQAEKTACGDWSTLNTWLEFFFEVLLEVSESLQDESLQIVERARLSKVQRKIISVVRTHGSLTRERIATETGINVSTVKYNLSVLAQRGHLNRHGGGRTTNYTLP